MNIQIRNWRAFNPRADVKKPSWFRLSHDLFEDPDFYDFSPSELLAWLYLLCHASKKNSETITVSIPHLERVGRIKEKDFLSAVQKLKKLNCVHVDDTEALRERYAGDTATNATRRTNETNETNDIAGLHSQSRRAFDFESLYGKYPRKDGKTKGMLACKTQIRSPEDFAALSMAIDRYADHIKRTATDPKFIKHFSTFMNSWRDWLETDTGSAPSAVNWEKVFGGKNAG